MMVERRLRSLGGQLDAWTLARSLPAERHGCSPEIVIDIGEFDILFFVAANIVQY
jgi:hypothetical protein